MDNKHMKLQDENELKNVDLIGPPNNKFKHWKIVVCIGGILILTFIGILFTIIVISVFH